VVLKVGCASSITTVVDLETSDGVSIPSFPGSAHIYHVDFPGASGTSQHGAPARSETTVAGTTTTGLRC